MIKFHYPENHYDPKFRRELFPLLKPFFKRDDFTDMDRLRVYGLSQNDYEFTTHLEEADKVILPMAWNYYLKTKQTAKAIDFIERAGKLNKQVFVIMVDDFGLNFPPYKHCLIFRMSGYRSKLDGNHIAFPAFINDPYEELYDGSTVFLRSYSDKPTVGFCGLANDSTLNILKEWIKIAIRNLRWDLRLSYVQKEQLISPSYLRSSLLKRISANSSMKSNFIIRSQYRAGVTNKRIMDPTRIEFFDNIKNSDYILCVRGAGNFSVRFYETLAMGRIPIFINTDCLLPFQDDINWKEHVLWIEYSELDRLEDKIIEYHKNLDEEKLNLLFIKNRKLWTEKLRLHSFFEQIKKIIDSELNQ